ncbi:MAG: hypothetical protein LBV52_03810 [Spirochaetaceae bacterium]|jgi:hypothetical protein|nr:hypothetical protein [Spirochaetaceae bacterium]
MRRKFTKLAGVLLTASLALVAACQTDTTPEITNTAIPNTVSLGSWGTLEGTEIKDLSPGQTYIVKAIKSEDEYAYLAVTEDGKLEPPTASVGAAATGSTNDIASAASAAIALGDDVSAITGLAEDGTEYDVILVITDAPVTNIASFYDTYVPAGKTLTIGGAGTLATGSITGDGTIKTLGNGSIAAVAESKFNIKTNDTGLTAAALNTSLGLVVDGAISGTLPANAILNVTGELTIATSTALNVAAGAEIIIGASPAKITLAANGENPGTIVLSSSAPSGKGAKLSFADASEETETEVLGRIAAAEITVSAEVGTATAVDAANLDGFPVTPASKIKSIQADSTAAAHNITIKGDSSTAGVLKTETTFATNS